MNKSLWAIPYDVLIKISLRILVFFTVQNSSNGSGLIEYTVAGDDTSLSLSLSLSFSLSLCMLRVYHLIVQIEMIVGFIKLGWGTSDFELHVIWRIFVQIERQETVAVNQRFFERFYGPPSQIFKT